MAKAAKFTTRHRDKRMLSSPIQHGSYIWIALRLRSRMRWRRRAGVVNDFLVHHARLRLPGLLHSILNNLAASPGDWYGLVGARLGKREIMNE